MCTGCGEYIFIHLVHLLSCMIKGVKNILYFKTKQDANSAFANCMSLLKVEKILTQISFVLLCSKQSALLSIFSKATMQTSHLPVACLYLVEEMLTQISSILTLLSSRQ